jgi:hypothetical protein
MEGALFSWDQHRDISLKFTMLLMTYLGRLLKVRGRLGLHFK